MNEHMGLLIVRHRSIVRAALVTVGVLLIPLWGIFYVDGWNWHWYGFVVAGAFVFSAALTYELVAKAMSNRAYRFGVGLAVVTAFALTWVNMVLAADENAAGWQAHRGDEPDETPLLVFYCPVCAEREFGEESAVT